MGGDERGRHGCDLGQRASKVFTIERRRVDEGVVEGVVAGRRGDVSRTTAAATTTAAKGGDDYVWDAILREATVDAAAEPMLSSYLYASILSHETLEQSLSFVLANKLADSTLLPTQLMEIFNTVLLDDETEAGRFIREAVRRTWRRSRSEIRRASGTRTRC